MKSSFTYLRSAPLWTLWALSVLAPAHSQESSSLQTCQAVVDGLEKLSPGVQLLASGTQGRSWKVIYDQCDRRNTFAGHKLPSYRFKPLRCSTDPNRVQYVQRYADGTVVFNAKMSVDADGSPVLGGSGWPNNVKTWLEFDSGSRSHFVNAEEVPFIVVPLPVPSGPSFIRDTGIGKGDLAVVVYRGRCSFGVVGDAGPWFRLGEASLRTHADLGNPQCANQGQHPCRRLRRTSGVGIPAGVTYIIFPGTRPEPLLSETVNEVAARQASKKVIEFLRSNAKP